MTENEREAVRTFARRVRDLLGERLIGITLFGSKARGDDTPESDIDLAVRVEGATTALEDAVLDIAYDINVACGIYISPRVIDGAVFRHPVWRETPFIRAVEREGVPV